jgi:DNA-binding MarR family transcriptional regulator
MTEKEPEKKHTDPFSGFLGGAAAAVSAAARAAASNPVFAGATGAALVFVVRGFLAGRSSSSKQLELSKDIDQRSVTVLLYLADGRERSFSEIKTRLEMTDRQVGSAVHTLAENELVEITDGEDRNDESATVRLSPTGRAAIVQISAMVTSR